MNYYLKQHFLTWGERFAISDESARNRFFVDSELFSFGKTMYLRTLGGNDIAQIKQKVWHLSPTYLISRAEKESVKLVYKKKMGFRAKKAGVSVEGDFLGHNYAVKDQSGVVLASVSEKWFTLGPAYGIDISAGADTDLMLAVILAVEACMDQRDKNRE